jgi:glutamate dehydrogenase (NADP+)
MNIDKYIFDLEKKYPNEQYYHQTIREFLESVEELFEQNSAFLDANIIDRLIEPDRIIIFKVPWSDDSGRVIINKGYRIQFNNALGPYKGGLRFHPNLNIDLLKSLSFEQTLKNSLTSLPMGGAKGGSDFNPKGKSDSEIMRFCQAFMLELWKIIGPDLDIPAGELGVGTREIGYMYGMYLKLSGKHQSVLTGKGTDWGGSHIKNVSTGYGLIFFLSEMFRHINENLEGKTIAISGFGNVAYAAAKKANELGAKVIAISGPDGYVYYKEGLSEDMIEHLIELRALNDDLIRPFSYEFPEAQFRQNRKVWEVSCDVALPCAIESEFTDKDAQLLIKNGVRAVVEGANNPCSHESIDLMIENGVMFGPGKAANAGGVATSGLEIAQNSMHITWTANEVEGRLHEIMKNIHEACAQYGTRADGTVNYQKGANVASFLRIANTMLDQGII